MRAAGRERAFAQWLAAFWAALGGQRPRRWAPVYGRGLLGPGGRKCVEPLAERTAPAVYRQLHHFASGSPWDLAPLERW